MYSWAGQIAFVDLSSRHIEVIPTSDYSSYLGGRGVGVRIVSEQVPVNAGALDASNWLAFMAGPLTGTLAPSSSRLAVVGKNALTSGIGTANVGGNVGPAIKFSGFDGVVVAGVSGSPVTVELGDGRVEIRDGEHLWGLDTWETEDAIYAACRGRRPHIASIGPAGENLCRIACIMSDSGRAAAYGGLGAVMGSKKLKAIVAHGGSEIRVAGNGQLVDAAHRAIDKLRGLYGIESLRRWGTLTAGAGGVRGDAPQPVRNLTDEYWPADKTQRISPQVFADQFHIRRLACFGCTIACSRFCSVKSGRNKELILEGIQANLVDNFASLVDSPDPVGALLCSSLCNQLGLDADGMGASLAWACEAFQRGHLTRDDFGVTLGWGDIDSLTDAISATAVRLGIGDLLADGPRMAARRLGRGEEYALHIKGAPLRESGMRSDLAWSLGITLSARGSGHLNGAIRLERAQQLSSDTLMQLGLKDALKVTSLKGIGTLVAGVEDFKAVVDSIGVCYMTSLWRDPRALDARDYADLLSAATGVDFRWHDLMSIGRRVSELERAFNTLHADFGRPDDYPPQRLFNTPISGGPYAGKVLAQETWDLMLDEYYSARGWDRVSGKPPDSCLRIMDERRRRNATCG